MKEILLSYINAKAFNQILIIITISLFMFFIIWIIKKIPFLFKKIKVGNVELLSENKDNKLPSKGHLNCPHVSDLFLLEELRDRYHEERMDISDRYSITTEQLVYARMIIDNIINSWSEELDKNTIPYKKLMLDNIRNIVIQKANEVFQENHLAEMDEIALEKRANQRAESICSLVFSGTLSNKIEEDMKKMMHLSIVDIIRKAREIQINKNIKIEKLKREYSEKRNKILKGDFVDICA